MSDVRDERRFRCRLRRMRQAVRQHVHRGMPRGCSTISSACTTGSHEAWMRRGLRQIAGWMSTWDLVAALDVGCGVGRYTVMLADRYDDVVGIDAAPAMIEFAERDRSRPNIHYQTRDVLSLTPEHDGIFDLVLAISCVVHVGPPKLVLSHLRSLVAKGGTLLLLEPMLHSWWGSRDWQVDFAFRAA